MDRIDVKTMQHERRRAGIRKKIRGAPDRPRLSVYRSLRHIYAQVIDDLAGRTVAAASSLDKGADVVRGAGRKAAASVGTRLAERARKAGVERVVFDRGGRRYHGRVKALAEAAREGGLKF